MTAASIAVFDLPAWQNLADDLLFTRAKQSTGGWAHFFLARAGNDEAGLLVLDLLDRPPCAVIREIFVVPDCRRRGVGGKLLAHAEKVATRNDLPTLGLEVRPLDDGTSRELLIRWYLRNGFGAENGSVDKMVKELSDRRG